MATVYLITGKNSGKDVSVTITDSNGNQFNAAQLGIMTHFEIEVDYVIPETKSIINGGQVFFEALPHGAKCKMKFVRTNSALEDLETYYRENSYNGNQLSYTIQYMTTNRDGTINVRQLIDCKPHNFNSGAYAADQDVTQSVDWVSTDINSTGVNTSLFTL